MPFAQLRSSGYILQRSASVLSALVLGMGASMLCLGNRAHAAEQIVVRFKQAEVTVSTREIAEFVDTGFLPNQLQDFLNEHKQVPADLREVLTERIKVDRKFVEKALDSSIGRFALLKLDELIQNSSVQEDLESLQAAIEEEVEELGSISLLGLIEAYPTPVIRLNLSGLESAYADAKHFIEDIEPALGVAKAFLQDIVCECETETAEADSNNQETIAVSNSNCVKSPVAATGTSQPSVNQQDAAAESLADTTINADESASDAQAAKSSEILGSASQ